MMTRLNGCVGTTALNSDFGRQPWCGWLLLLLFGSLSGCKEARTQTPLFVVAPTEFNHQVRASGALFAVNSKQISAPTSQRGPAHIAYIAPEYSMLKPGDLVIRFEGHALLEQQTEAGYQLQGLQFDLTSSQHNQQTEQQQLGLQQQLVGTEFEFVDRFAIDDIAIRSRLEILDSLQNKDYLAERQRFLDWQQQNMAQRFAGESGLLEQRLTEQQRRQAEASSGLQSLELRAEHAGMLVLEANWQGEKATVGKVVFPGFKVASIPDLSKQHLRLQVAETEAAGLAAGQAVQFVVLSRAAEQLEGKVVSVDSAAKSVSKRNPRKFVEVVVAPTKQQTWFVPGSRVDAQVQLAQQQQVLAVPAQAVFTEQTESYVWKWLDGDFVRQPVQIAARGLYQVVIAQGVQSGDQIALIVPQRTAIR